MPKTLDLKNALSEVEEFADNVYSDVEDARQEARDKMGSTDIEELQTALGDIEKYLDQALEKME